ncbi:MAG: class I SAM-dependent methyltransferase [Thalassovita sp.]
MNNKIDTKAVGLDVGLAAVKFLTGKENLHYGLWNDFDLCAANLGPAQEAYTEKLFKLLPDRPLKILDIGGGAGVTARKLLDLGHTVEIIVPSAYLAQRCRENAPNATLHEMMFEDFQTDQTFDLCLFSESFQYIPMDISLSRCAQMLTPDGLILIADCFRKPAYYLPDRTSRVGGGHPFEDYKKALNTSAFDALSEEDITVDVAPSVQLEQDFFHVIGLGVDRFNDELQTKKPFARKVIRGFLGLILTKRRRAKLYDRLTGNTRTAEQFVKYNHYIMTALAKKA